MGKRHPNGKAKSFFLLQTSINTGVKQNDQPLGQKNKYFFLKYSMFAL